MELTKEQNKLCYSLKLLIIKKIVHTSNEEVWKIIKNEVEEVENAG